MKERYYFSCDDFGKRLRHERIEKGLTQRQLAALVGVEERQIRRYETGKQSPPMPHLVGILFALEKPLWQFVDMDREVLEQLLGKGKELVPPTVELSVLLQAISDRFTSLENQIHWLKDARD